MNPFKEEPFGLGQVRARVVEKLRVLPRLNISDAAMTVKNHQRRDKLVTYFNDHDVLPWIRDELYNRV